MSEVTAKLKDVELHFYDDAMFLVGTIDGLDAKGRFSPGTRVQTSYVCRVLVETRNSVYEIPVTMLHADDHAAEVSRLEARVEELEREVVSVRNEWIRADADAVSLLAQLEAARLRLGYYAEGVDLQGIASKVNREAVERDALRYGPGTAGHAQLTAQTDGVRELAEGLLTVLECAPQLTAIQRAEAVETAKRKLSQALTTPAASTPPEGKVWEQARKSWADVKALRSLPCECVKQGSQRLIQCVTCDLDQALAAPAPQVRVYQDTEDAYKDTAPAPAPVCVCGHSKADHAEKHGWECSEECTCLKYTPAPACKECGKPSASPVWGVCRDCFDKTNTKGA